MSKKALITGSAGLIGSESVRFLAQKDFQIIGIDNYMRGYFFGSEGDPTWNNQQLLKLYPNQYIFFNQDIVLVHK